MPASSTTPPKLVAQCQRASHGSSLCAQCAHGAIATRSAYSMANTTASTQTTAAVSQCDTS